MRSGSQARYKKTLEDKECSTFREITSQVKCIRNIKLCRFVKNNDILMHDVGNIGKWVAVGAEARTVLIPDYLALGYKTVQFGPPSQVDMRKNIFAVLVGVPDNDHHILARLEQRKALLENQLHGVEIGFIVG